MTMVTNGIARVRIETLARRGSLYLRTWHRLDVISMWPEPLQ